MDADEFSVNDTQTNADARLITASPMLLEACQEALARCTDHTLAAVLAEAIAHATGGPK